MKARLSLLMITKNCEELLEKSLGSCKGLVSEVVTVDNFSTDKTREIAKKFKAKVFLNKEENLGKQREFGLKKVSNKWVLVLDADEIIAEELQNEIKSKIKDSHFAKASRDKQKSKLQIKNQKFIAYNIPFQNHFLGKPVNHGGEDYKMLRLFKKDSVTIEPALVHEKFKIKRGRIGKLKNKIYHYSYRSILQMFKKFTDYAAREAKQKALQGERTSLKKILLYPPHMFWARFVEDRGYKDGIFRIPLDLGFAYMEFLTYFLLLFFEQSREVRFWTSQNDK